MKIAIFLLIGEACFMGGCPLIGTVEKSISTMNRPMRKLEINLLN
nr:hypothetical protein [Priestia megaterium]